MMDNGQCKIITAQWGSCVALIGAAASGCNRVFALICLNFAVGFMGAGRSQITKMFAKVMCMLP